MSACISRHGEYGEHDTDVDYTCRRCHVLDEEGMKAELRQLRHERLASMARSVPVSAQEREACPHGHTRPSACPLCAGVES